MGKFREKLYRFMMGRYGTDILNKDNENNNDNDNGDNEFIGSHDKSSYSIIICLFLLFLFLRDADHEFYAFNAKHPNDLAFGISNRFIGRTRRPNLTAHLYLSLCFQIVDRL